jgi:Nif-specific regulatory protein
MTARVVDTGRAVVVPQVSREPALAHAAGRGELTFIAVPIVAGRRPAGALEIFLRYKKDRDYQRSLEFYRLVASMIAHALKSARLVEAERLRLAQENEHLRDELRDRYAFRNIIGNSAPIQQVYEQVTQVARTNTTVLIRGESGTGKEMVAHAIHYNSPRAKKPFVKVSCAALPESLIESELFGYEKGAFTGAQGTKKGRFELADGGTLFLDEIGDLNPATQVKLLRVLQEREIERLGGTTTIKINVRLIAATHQPLETLIEEGKFRSDLYYRLAVFTIFAPPLRERKPDIMLLADHFLEKYSREHGKRIRRVSTPAIDMLTSYHWPGNVRELENTIERSVLVCDGGVIHGHHLPPALQTAEASGTTPRMSLAESVEAYERDLLQDALKSTRGNRARAARLLGTTERIFNYKVRKYGVDPRRFKN